MKHNVVIRHYKGRRLVEERRLHNVWTTVGAEYLAELVGLTSFLPDVPERSDRLKYFQLGMGSKEGGVSADATVAATYPAGSDPNATAGNEYDRTNHTQPHITTLELPVKKTGSTVAYPGNPGDVWLFGPADGLEVTHQDRISATVRVLVDTSLGDITGIWAPTELVDISEAGLLLSSADVNTPYNPVVAYASFASITLDDDSQLEFIWTVRFLV